MRIREPDAGVWLLLPTGLSQLSLVRVQLEGIRPVAQEQSAALQQPGGSSEGLQRRQGSRLEGRGSEGSGSEGKEQWVRVRHGGAEDSDGLM